MQQKTDTTNKSKSKSKSIRKNERMNETTVKKTRIALSKNKQTKIT